MLETPVDTTLVTDFFSRSTMTVISRGICVKLGASNALNLLYLIKCIEIPVPACKLEHKNVLHCSDELQQIRNFITTGVRRGLQICHFFPLFGPLFKWSFITGRFWTVIHHWKDVEHEIVWSLGLSFQIIAIDFCTQSWLPELVISSPAAALMESPAALFVSRSEIGELWHFGVSPYHQRCKSGGVLCRRWA